MRIAKADLEKGNYANVKTVVPMLFVAQNFNSGIYIYGDYVYFATPTTDKNLSGEVESSWIDFKCAKLDGSEAMKNYYFRLENNASNYRFVEENGAVYCLYEEDSALKSYKVAENGKPVESSEPVVLVKGANYIEALAKTNSIIFDKTGTLTNGDFEVPEGVEKIGDHAFYNVSSLRSITLPTSLKEIGKAPFYITNLNKITYKGTMEEFKLIKKEVEVFGSQTSSDTVEVYWYHTNEGYGVSVVNCNDGDLNTLDETEVEA